jgi:hypothetical protein
LQTPSWEQIPSPVTVSALHAQQTCDALVHWETGLRQSCPDRAEVDYIDLALSPVPTIRQLCEFLELSAYNGIKPSTSRPPNRELPQRIANFVELQRQPGAWREFLVEEGV